MGLKARANAARCACAGADARAGDVASPCPAALTGRTAGRFDSDWAIRVNHSSSSSAGRSQPSVFQKASLTGIGREVSFRVLINAP